MYEGERERERKERMRVRDVTGKRKCGVGGGGFVTLVFCSDSLHGGLLLFPPFFFKYFFSHFLLDIVL